MHGGFIDVGFKSGVVVWKWWNFVCQWNPPVFVAGLGLLCGAMFLGQCAGEGLVPAALHGYVRRAETRAERNNLAGSADTIQTQGHFTLDGRTRSHFIQLDAGKLGRVAVQAVFLSDEGNMRPLGVRASLYVMEA
jgi:hypothetical protein